MPTVVYCAGGYRSSVAASLLRQNGFADVSDILGGYGAWEEATPERLSDTRRPDTMTTTPNTRS